MGLRLVEFWQMKLLSSVTSDQKPRYLFFLFGVNEINDKFVAPYKTLARSFRSAFPSLATPFSLDLSFLALFIVVMKSALLSIASAALYIASVSTQTTLTVNTPLVPTILSKNCFLTLEPVPMWSNVNLFRSPGVVALVSVFSKLPWD